MKRTAFLTWIELGLLLLSFVPTRLNANTYYYVATNGLDSRTGLGGWTNAVATISNAVALATTDGDVVLLSNGVYILTTNISIVKGITVKACFGREATIVDGNYPNKTNSCFFLNHGGALLDSLTISNAYYVGAYGGGISLQQGSVTNCVITKCTGGQGGGIGMNAGWTGTVAHCVVAYNSAYTGGGGIGSGSVGTTGVIHHCVVYGNTGTQGGGIRLRGSLVYNCIISSNIASGTTGGGGMIALGTPPITEYRNCLFIQNIATNASAFGGGGYIGAANSVRMVNCTIVSNYARSSYGTGGLYLSGDTTPTNSYVNCIIYSNNANASIGKDIGFDSATSTTDRFANCCAGSIGSYGTAKYLPSSQGNITNNPAFADWNAGNYRMQNGSPCINTGTNQDWMNNARDMDGHSRMDFFSRQVDIGAFECLPAGTMYTGH